jgi:hypothetical protein
MRELTISEAARRCGVHRRTLQRAIQRGRLHLTPAAHLTLDALQQAGYTAAAPQDAPQDAPQRYAAGIAQTHAAEAPQVTPQDLARMITLLETMAEDLHALRTRLVPGRTTGAPQDMPQGTFDTSKYVLGKLCPRGHAWGNTGQSLLRRTNRHCIVCDREKFQERGKAQRQTRRQQKRQQKRQQEVSA